MFPKLQQKDSVPFSLGLLAKEMLNGSDKSNNLLLKEMSKTNTTKMPELGMTK